MKFVKLVITVIKKWVHILGFLVFSALWSPNDPTTLHSNVLFLIIHRHDYDIGVLLSGCIF